MTTEISGGEPAVTVEKTSKENRSSNTNPSGEEGAAVNGISNGYVDKHAKKEHSGDRDKHREKEKDRHRDKSRDKPRDKHASSSSSSKDKDKKHSSSSSSSKDKDKDKERRNKDDRKEKDREHKSLSGKDKEHNKSSSSSKDKEKDRHSKDKSSSHRVSSGSKDKHGSSSSSKDKSKHGSSERKSSGDKDRHKSSRDKPVKVKEEDRHKEKEVPKVKREEPEEPHRMAERAEEQSPPREVDDEMSAVTVKAEPMAEDSDEDIPLARRAIPIKREIADEESEDDVPLMARKKVKKEKPSKKRKAVSEDDEEEEEDFKPERKKKKVKKEVKKEVKREQNSSQGSPKKKKNEKEEAAVWKWWEEEKKDSAVKWTFLEHKGPVFAPLYEPLPSKVRFYYNGKEMRLSESAEEVATFYARMLEHDYVTKEAFNKNFFKDWRKQMSKDEQEKITDLSKCNFKDMHAYFVQKNEERKAMSKEEKKKIKEANEEQLEEYGFCTIDGHKEKIGNFKIEPPGLFRGRGEHPKMGMLKKRVVPEDVIINCSKNSEIPVAPAGHKWKEVRHDNNVTWLASWTENVQGQVKYVMLNPSSKLKGEKDWQKYEVARKLHKSINKIRNEYREHWKSKEMRIRQRSVALYFIDKLALRAGNEKDDDQADTVGCCSLRVEHISLHEEKNGKEWVVVFDFLGKDSIRYYNEVSVEKRVFKNLQLFMQNKATGDDLFDRLNTMIMNKHLSELMPGLTAKVFRTYNASITLQDQLNKLTEPDMSVQEKILAYNRANRAVAILCNHQRAVPKTFAKSMENMQAKIEAKQDQIREAEKQFKQAKRDCKNDSSAKSKIEMEKKRKAVERLKEQMDKMNLQATDKEENKDIALGTSKLNYLDPRISVAWCKKHDVPIEKIYNKTQRSKFNWAIDMATEDFVF